MAEGAGLAAAQGGGAAVRLIVVGMDHGHHLVAGCLADAVLIGLAIDHIARWCETPASAAISSSFIMLALFELQGPRWPGGAPKSVRGIISLKRTFCGILNNALKRFSLECK
jgi:hypothetical protein